MTPIVDGLEQTYGGQIAVQRINADKEDGPAIMRDYKLPGHPVLLIFNSQQQEVYRFIGPQPADEIELRLQEVLNVER